MQAPRISVARRCRAAWLWALVVLGVGSAWAAVPTLISYQGKLIGADAAPVPDGSYRMEFRFWDDCTGGQLLLTDVHEQVETRDGLYAVLLGGGELEAAVEPDVMSVFRNHDVVCLGVRVADDTEMVPRQQIVSAAFALRSAMTDEGSTAHSVAADDSVTWTGVHTFENTVELGGDAALSWPHETGTPAPDASFELMKFTAMPSGQAGHPNGEADEQWMFCYNCSAASTHKQDVSQHSFNLKYEANYWDGVRELNEYNWNYRSPHRCIGGALDGATCLSGSDCDGGSCASGPDWRPFAFVLQVTDTCRGGALDGASCVGALARAACAGGGGRCTGSNEAAFGWETSQRGICSNDLFKTCDFGRPDSGECGAGVCQRPRSDMSLVPGRGWLDLSQGLIVDALHPGTLSTSEGSFFTAWLKQRIAPPQGGTFIGLRYNGTFGDQAASGARLESWRGAWVLQSFEGSQRADRGIADDMTAFRAEQVLSQTAGGSPSIQTLAGFRYLLNPSGRNVSVGNAAGLMLELGGPIDAAQPVAFGRLSGVEIGDLRGLGTQNQAVRVASQTGGRGDAGNVLLVGGGATNGHLQLGASGHLFWDADAGIFRTKDAAGGAPASDGDGAPLHAPPGMSNDWGVALWGRSGSATDSGDLVCQAARLTCVETLTLVGSVGRSCGSKGHTGLFLAFCR